ncbi:MAG: class I SAM-dependent RNA methyltransferase [Clostridia bacterium]|nr:class I SAM-dependent RNA methyltransferase [Clostridia bacterium]
MFRLCVPVLFGLEGIVADELRRLEFADVSAENGRVLFSGGLDEAVRANLWLRCGERVGILIGEFPARTFEELYQGVSACPLESVIDPHGAFPVKGHSVRSQLASIPDCQRIINKAAADRLMKSHAVTSLPEDGAKYQLSFNILNDICSLTIDTTGAPLYKRGYRTEATAAPIRETLAAAMVYLSKRRGDRPLCDPMCGSGTILIEAALLASNTAPGLARRFAVESFAGFDRQTTLRLRREAKEQIGPFEGEIFGSDIDPEAIRIAKENAARAGFAERIRLTRCDLANADMPQSGIVITNPPYGERLGEVDQARELYKLLGKRIQTGSYIISPDEQFEKHFGRRADKKRKLYNGMIKCDLYMYYKGGLSK